MSDWPIDVNTRIDSFGRVNWQNIALKLFYKPFGLLYKGQRACLSNKLQNLIYPGFYEFQAFPFATIRTKSNSIISSERQDEPLFNVPLWSRYCSLTVFQLYISKRNIYQYENLRLK
ncbi:hypothetical protein PHYBLDRAFT_166878 [Phycomyces blakesleeanus NRRL 1555(-)]|uniref:Uncharacterized protein n=1 Tax=Phycomyces blakesleeanus (strain ATCC 8743b / DSM 1359 / FGSC 10004 / NBRC 33097 / NRRL 1555) TaxID=763407 RepID=A0A167NC86_PHYB8|nr:hypothetical protein PHYBLDRAFT_166878 [Phycomyces blakesleeanus NRRL 1555(-)]OAD75650.1 hypothetical protein PHYBLDRAFT_166878 [Phycomyces blakesleeanus NRRL 1555(-)]|eukprot:XP_018293690.1 hypothetical protein PHYBLDRAFT_166878 [Phycomyces blakesleeanus NRRL 1555(-)]